jgi:hypothetical protein
LDYLAEGSEVNAFNRQQVREERIKAALMLEREAWKELIFSAERHGYFNGQIEFLLKFSGILDHWLAHKSIAWSDEEHTHAQNLFSDYLEKANAAFDANGLRLFSDNRWERALLALGDYTLSHGRNWSFLQNRVGSGERRPTWKLLLRGHMTDAVHERKRLLVKALFDKIDLQREIEDSLEEVSRTVSTEEPWRRMLVEAPRMIAYCGQKMFRFLNDGSVYLISKLRTTSDHVELWSYYLYHTALVPMRDGGGLSPFTVSYISANNEDYVPFISLTCDKGPVFIRIDFTDGKFRIALTSTEVEFQQFLNQRIEQSFEVEKRDGEILFNASDQQVESIIGKIVIMARAYDDKK